MTFSHAPALDGIRLTSSARRDIFAIEEQPRFAVGLGSRQCESDCVLLEWSKDAVTAIVQP